MGPPEARLKLMYSQVEQNPLIGSSFSLLGGGQSYAQTDFAG